MFKGENMTVRELVKIMDDKYAILIEDLTIVKQLLINELPQHSTAISSCNSWKELYDEIKPYMEMVETSIGKYRYNPNPIFIIKPKYKRKYLRFEAKKISLGNEVIFIHI